MLLLVVITIMHYMISQWRILGTCHPPPPLEMLVCSKLDFFPEVNKCQNYDGEFSNFSVGLAKI